MSPASRPRLSRIRWTPGAESPDWSPISLAVQPWDHHTHGPPLAAPRLVLEREGPAGTWQRVRTPPVSTPSGILAWSGLEHRRFAQGVAPVRYRLTVDTELYVPAFRESRDDEPLQIQPYDDRGPPPPPAAPLRLLLYPSVAYPFEPRIPVLRGTVEDAQHRPVRDALLGHGPRERVLTDAKGAFALPLRQASPGTASIHVSDRQGRADIATITLPQSLTSAVTFTLR
ncbi:carboxypeptidase-like regulatory domain-containing protein [Pyxidicoccus xibeiensis]|uniref:carboxypeptidase-like regulatory domain-containing protein n=1 Tax=Pyxidicoccus xibeiensis TaxID=2906759 RepID=UPI0020A79932|nr:carboxypeptidase-like regulatory domain-containing protein [Pyxidicoccus xibeiensis]MCP3143400.1 carboxypeptidase-like regulatory domain-containing protein [Pyxidicoccus xibeiensis]